MQAAEPLHPVMRSPKNASGKITLLPAHPHEGAVSVPKGAKARVIATGHSKLTGRSFNLAVAFDGNGGSGRAIADSSFHHFLDYNLDPGRGCPSFVTEPRAASFGGATDWAQIRRKAVKFVSVQSPRPQAARAGNGSPRLWAVMSSLR